GAVAEKTPAAALPGCGPGGALIPLPVFVPDGSGRAGGGLEAESFHVEDEGRPVKVVRFQEIDVDAPVAEEQMRRIPAARRQFLLLFDLSFSTAGGILNARRAAAEFVEKDLASADLAAVATFST